MARSASLSGFPELLPAERVIEEHVIGVIRRTFELHGYGGIETRSVEPLSQLTAKGETSKEVYLLRRLQADPSVDEGGRTLGLHFDLTVPFARYVVENAGHLQFPFKRFQIQKAWRGERPQEGRTREFLQADIDVIGEEDLPFHFDVEVALVAARALTALRADGLPPIRMSVNNRKLSQGFYEGIGISDVEGTLRTIDKLDKIGTAGVTTVLTEQIGLSADQARQVIELASITATDPDELHAAVQDLGVEHPLLTQGLAELGTVLAAASEFPAGVIVGDLKIARGLDYYTGTVFETSLVGHEDLGSICSGGRYDSLATDRKRTFPGVGISIGVTRILARVLSAELMSATRPVPTAVLVAVNNESERAASELVAQSLRARDIAVEVAPTAAKFGKQIRYADRRGIPFVWFCGSDGADDQVKAIDTGDQAQADANTWTPPAPDAGPRVIPGPGAGN